jgi:hypothetical protein
MDAVVQETLMCAFGGDARKMPYAQLMAQSAIHQALRAGEAENGFALRHLEDALRRLAQMPGERVLVLVSPGFLLVQQPHGERQIVEQANRANIVINTIDVRGLNVSGGAEDISRQSTDMSATGDYKSRDRMDADRDRSIVLADFAHGTGGTFFHNSNDLTAGIKMAALPKICYVLGFSPHDLKEDGRYHSLEVKLTGKQKYSVQARRGYFAPTRLNPKEQEDQDIAEELHSRAEFGNLLSELRAQPSMNGQDKPQLLVRSQVAVQNVRFKTMNGKRVDVLRMVTAIFDENGNLVSGGEKILTLNLDNPAYEKLSRAGLTVNLSFGVKPGKYLVRQLLRDSEAGEIATKNRAVEIAE